MNSMKRLILTAYLFLFVFPVSTNAEEVQALEGNIAMNSLEEHGNSYFIIEGNPGERKNVAVNLSNTSNQYPASATFFVADAVTAQGGGMGVIPPELASRQNVGGWFEHKEQLIRLKPNESRDIRLNFTIPNNVRPGDHIGTIVLYKYSPATAPEKSLGNDEAQVLVNKAYSQSIAVLVKVPGKLDHRLVLKSIEPLWNGSNLFLNLTISNEGNVIEKSRGKIKIMSDEGEVIYEHQGEMNSIYPKTSGVYSFLASERLKKSREYSVEVNWNYTENSTGKITEKTFPFTISSKDIKHAKLTELATLGKNNHSSLAFNAFDFVPKNILVYGSMILFIVILIIVFIIAQIFKYKKRSYDSVIINQDSLSRIQSRGLRRKK